MTRRLTWCGIQNLCRSSGKERSVLVCHLLSNDTSIEKKAPTPCGQKRILSPPPPFFLSPVLCQATREYVRGLPIEDPPETFGLHPNADITFQQKETNNLLETIILMVGGGGGGGGGGAGNTDTQVRGRAIGL
jgi:hypothetical protein